MQNAYNTIRYPSYAKAQTHPDHLATLATLFGLNPAPARRCRVLEIGCGTADNLIAMAHGLPDSEFVGIDLASEPIAEGRRIAAALGLRNIDLRAMDLMDFGPESGTFDYIVAMGVFGWVPEFVRQKMLALSASQLSAHGVAFFSYNCYPGFYLRAIVRDLLLYHTAGMDDPEQAIEQAFGVMKLIQELQPQNAGEYAACLKSEMGKTLTLPPGGLFHDELEKETRAFYFHDVVAMARACGLEYLGEAEFFMTQAHARGEKTEKVLQQLTDDVVRREQYMDFVHGRRFRQTLFCRAGLPIEREVKSERMRQMVFSCPARLDADGKYRRATGVPLQPVHPLAIAALQHLAAAWPRRVGFAQLLGSCGASDDNADALCEILLGCFSAGVIDVHMDVPHFTMEPGERPVLSPLARLQLARSDVTVNLCHRLVRIPDETCRRLAQLLDGTRDRTALARELGIAPEEVDECLKQLPALALMEG